MDHLEKLFLAHGGIMKTCELKEASYYYKKIQSHIESGKIERLDASHFTGVEFHAKRYSRDRGER